MSNAVNQKRSISMILKTLARLNFLTISQCLTVTVAVPCDVQRDVVPAGTPPRYFHDAIYWEHLFPLISRTTGWIFKIQTVFASPGEFIEANKWSRGHWWRQRSSQSKMFVHSLWMWLTCKYRISILNAMQTNISAWIVSRTLLRNIQSR